MVNRTIPPLLAVVALLAAAPAPAAETLASTLARIDKAAVGFKTMSAAIRRLNHLDVIKEDNIDSGTVLIKRPKPRDLRMLMRLTDPDTRSVAVFDNKAQFYFPKIQTVQEYDLGKYRSLMDQFLLLGFGSTSKELESGYTVRLVGPESIGGQETTRLELIPKSKDVLPYLKKVEIWVSDQNGFPVQQKFYQAAGDYTLVTYSQFKANPDLPDSALKLQLPRDVKREYPQK